MQLIVWNSQGAKWDTAWTNYVAPLVTKPATNDVGLFLVEAGWAPWVTSGDVVVNSVYGLDTQKTWYDPMAAATSAFCVAVESERRYQAVWVPWVKNLNAMKTNTRCSIGAALFPKDLQLAGMDSTRFDEFIRPTLRFRLGKGNNVNFVILLEHMVSGKSTKAQEQLEGVMNEMQKLVPEGCAALIIGDMNVDLLKAGTMNNLPKNWNILKTGVATHQSGGELDFGLLYDPTGKYGGSAVSVVQQFKTGANQSDHSVLRYTIPT